MLDSDVLAAYQGDPAAQSVDEVLLCYPGVQAMIYHRIAHELYTNKLPLLARIAAEMAHAETGIDINPGAQIGRSFFIDHGTGVVIGETTIIGERVRIYQAVTLGAKSFPTDEDGSLQKGLPRHPVVEDDVVIYAGANDPRACDFGQRLRHWRQCLANARRACRLCRHPGSLSRHSTLQVSRTRLFDPKPFKLYPIKITGLQT